jgi:hypothetical protein
MLVQPTQRRARLADNIVDRSLWRQGVACDRDIEAMGERSFGDEGEALLGVALPITAMEEQQHRGAAAARGEEIESCPRRIAKDQIEMIRHAGAERLAAAQPIGDIPVAICHGGGVVVSGIERLPMHRAVDNHAVPRFTHCVLPELATPTCRCRWNAHWRVIAAKPAQAFQIDDCPGTGEPLFHHRGRRMTAGQNLHVIPFV